MSDVRIGLVLPTREAAMAGRPEVEPLLRFAEAAETAGFHSLWAGDAPFARPRFEPLTLLSAVAARTRRATIGTAILLPALRHPLLLAHAAATLDRVAGGRLVLGVGAGWVQHEFEALGVPFEQRVGRMLETIEICRRVWRAASEQGADPPDAPGHGEAAAVPGVDFDGRYWQFRGVKLFPPPVDPEGPAIWLGGGGAGRGRTGRPALRRMDPHLAGRGVVRADVGVGTRRSP